MRVANTAATCVVAVDTLNAALHKGTADAEFLPAE